MTSTVSTLPLVLRTLKALFTTALATASEQGTQVQVNYTWQGADTEQETVFLSTFPQPGSPARIDRSQEIANIKAGRKHRNEEYTVPITVWVVRTDLTPLNAQTAVERSETIVALLADVLADDPTLGLDPGVLQWAVLTAGPIEYLPYGEGSGWVVSTELSIEVHARLI